MTNVDHFVGIDVSKDFFDVAIVLDISTKAFAHERFTSTKEGFGLFHAYLREHVGKDQAGTVVCMEYTGLYNWPILQSLAATKYLVCLEMAMQIKYSLGIQRGKNDRMDAKRIAEYAFVQREKLRQWRPSGITIDKLAHLMAARERLVDTIKKLEVPIRELKQVGNTDAAAMMDAIYGPMMEQAHLAMEKTDALLQETVLGDPTIATLYDRVKSVKGVGVVIAIYLIIYTKGFTMLADKKMLGSYAGVVPFDHTSGKSVRKKSRTSKMTNATLRAKLAMGAKSAMQWEPELKAYAEKKMKEGKSYSWCIVAVSNKLLARVVSCVNNQKKYVVRTAA